MSSGTNTPKLDLVRIQENWQFGDEAFNKFIDDADDKLVGIAHLQSPMHWTEWTELTAYHKDDVVRYPSLKSHQYARCLQDGTSDEEVNIPTNDVTGSIITDGTTRWEVCSLTQIDADSGTIRIWLGGGTYYHRGEAVRYGDALYRAKVDHESSASFDLDENKWQEIYASIRFWKPLTYYYLDDTAIYDDIIYKCTRAHKSVANFETVGSTTGDEDDWEIIGGAGGAKNWTANTKYQYGQLVLLNGILYRCNTKHRSSSGFSTDIAYWDLVDAQIHDWYSLQYYVAGTLVSHDNIIYKCLTTHTASATFKTDIDKWELYHNHIIEWQRNYPYYQGQIILYEDRLYKCNNTHVSPNEITENAGEENETTRNATFLDDISNFDVIFASLAVWAKNTVYKVGDTILYNNEPFRCVKNHTSGNANDSTIFDDITSDSNNCWEHIRLINAYITNWASSVTYEPNQLVMYRGTLYRCNTLHTSTGTFDATKWDLVYANIQEWVTATPYKLGSMVLNNNKLYVCINAHTSSTFATDNANWTQIGGAVRVEDWKTATDYTVNTLVYYGGSLYRCNADHTSTTFSADSSNWDKAYASIVDWSASTYYQVGTTVLYDNVLYKCSTAHTSGATFDATKWQLVYANIRNYANSTVYKQGSIVLYNNQLYQCLVNHTSSGAALTDEMFVANETIRYPEYTLLYPNRPLPDTVVWDLGSIKTLYYLYLGDRSPYTGNGDTVYAVQASISVDGINYTTVLNHYDPSQYNLVERVPLNGQTARYIKLYVTGVNHAWTVELMASVDTATQYWRLLSDSMIQYWHISTLYNVNSTVLYNGNLYVCTKIHTSGNTLEANSDCWIKVSGDAIIETWATNMDYRVGSTVVYEGIAYRCKTDHRSTSFSSDIAKWDKLYATIADWKTNTYYSVGTQVLFENEFYKCITAHTSSTDTPRTIVAYTNNNNFITYAQGNWGQTATPIEYVVDLGSLKDITNVSFDEIPDRLVITELEVLVSEDGTNYDSIYTYSVEYSSALLAQKHFSANCMNKAQYVKVVVNTIVNSWVGDVARGGALKNLKVTVLNTYWQLLGKNITEIHDWKTNTVYIEDEIVVYNGALYKCIEAHLSSTFDDTKWEKLSETDGSSGIEDWASGVEYAKDDVVLYNGILYRNNATHTSDVSFANDATYWDIVYASIPTWTTNVYYPVNMIVSYNNLTYKCVSAHTASADFNTDIANWILFNNSITTWAASTTYRAGQVVIHNGLLYKCNANHISGAVFDPTKFDGFGVDIKHEIPDYPIEQGMNVKVTTDKKLIANDLTKWVRAAGKTEEINKLGVRDLKNKDIFGDWKTYTCNSDGTDWNDETNAEQVAAKNSYSFNTTYDAIICSRNNAAFSAFISKDLYEPDYTVDYTIDNRILAQVDQALCGDDDGLFFILGFMQDANGDYHTLSVIRNGDSESLTSAGHGTRFAIAYDLYTSWINSAGSTMKLLATNNTLTPNAWDATSYAKLQVTKTSTTITAKTSEINSDSFAVTLTYTLPATKPSDMTQEQYDNIKYMLEHDTRIGFGTQSNCSAFKLLNSSGSIRRISVYNTDTIKKETYESSVKISETDDTKVLLPQELVYSELNKRLYYVKGEKDVKEIQLNNLCEEWKSETFYVKDSIVSYNGLIYKCKEVNDDISFDISKWDLVYTNLISWQANTHYFIGNTVIYNNQIYRCISDNADSVWDGTNWKLLNSVETWDADVYYPLHILAVYDGELYRCITAHTSTNSFDDTKWEKLSGTGGGGGGGEGGSIAYSQVSKYNVTANLDVPITIDQTLNFCLPPVEVLKFIAGAEDVVTNVFNFGVGDGSAFTIDGVSADEDGDIAFDGKVHLITAKELTMSTPTSIGDYDIVISEEIDVSNYKDIESLVNT